MSRTPVLVLGLIGELGELIGRALEGLVPSPFGSQFFQKPAGERVLFSAV
jgi:hypothetical protein